MSLHLSIQAEKTCRSELHLTQSSQSYWVRCLDREAGRKMHLHLFIISLSLYCHNGRRGKIACFRNGSKWLTDQTNVNNVHRAKQGSLSTWCRRLASAPSSRRLGGKKHCTVWWLLAENDTSGAFIQSYRRERMSHSSFAATRYSTKSHHQLFYFFIFYKWAHIIEENIGTQSSKKDACLKKPSGRVKSFLDPEHM